jgi:hypothetical protein
MTLSALYTFGSLVFAVSSHVIPSFSKRRVLPAPISFAPSENFEGIDGSWNTFAIRAGNPAQVSRVLVSTTSQQTWVVDARGCQPNDNVCAQSRGGLFVSNKSTTWQEQGFYKLYIEKKLGFDGVGMFGYDTVALGYLGEGGPSLQHQILGAFAVPDFWFGHFGVHPKTTNFTDLSDNVPSYMSTLKSQSLIPSVSWGYTQGASYRMDYTEGDIGEIN